MNSNNKKKIIYPCPPSWLPLALKFSWKRRRVGHCRNPNRRLCSRRRYHAWTNLSPAHTLCNKTAITCSIAPTLGMLYHPFGKSLQQKESCLSVCLSPCSYLWIDIHRCGMREGGPCLRAWKGFTVPGKVQYCVTVTLPEVASLHWRIYALSWDKIEKDRPHGFNGFEINLK